MTKAGISMKLKKVWMSEDTGKKSHYGVRTIGGVLGIAVLMVLLILGGVLLTFYLELPREVTSLGLVCAVTFLAVILALRLGRSTLRDATVFFLTQDDRLYAMDARLLIPQGRSLTGQMEGAARIQDYLRRLSQSPHIPAGATEILKVERLKENASHYAIVCQARHPNRNITLFTCFVVKGLPDEDLLLRELERRQSWQSDLEPAANHNPLGILVSGLVLAGFAALCVLSHPAVGRLPQAIYFPCLGAAFLSVFFLVYFIMRQRRGE